MKWTDEDIQKVEKFIELRDKGYYCDGAQLTEVYNRVLERNVGVTNCGSCLRQRVNELAEELARHKARLEKQKEAEELEKKNKKVKK